MVQRTWHDVADIDVREINKWGGLRAGIAHTVERNGPGDYPIAKTFVWRTEQDVPWAEVIYDWDAKPVFARVKLTRVQRPNGGWALYFLCPVCGAKRQRLAMLEQGLACRDTWCANIAGTHVPRSPIARLMWKATKVAVELGNDCWSEPPPREPPEGMRAARFAALTLRRQYLVEELGRRLARRKLYRGSTRDIRDEFMATVGRR